MSQQRQRPSYESGELSTLYRQTMNTLSAEEPDQYRGRGSAAANGSVLPPNGVHYDSQPSGWSHRFLGVLLRHK
jgi:hypothetical protein